LTYVFSAEVRNHCGVQEENGLLSVLFRHHLSILEYFFVIFDSLIDLSLLHLVQNDKIIPNLTFCDVFAVMLDHAAETHEVFDVFLVFVSHYYNVKALQNCLLLKH